MKKLFNLSLYPSKRKYEEQKQAVEVALQDIEKKRQRLLDAAVGGLSDEESEEESTDDYHDELMRCHQQKTRPNTSGMSDISIRPQTASLFTSGSGFETTLGLAVTMSLIPSTTMAESRQDIYSPKARTLETLKHKPSRPIMWMLKGVILMNFNSESKLVGSIELRTESTLEETRQLIKQFVPSLPKSYNFVQLPDCSVIDCSSEANLRTCLTYEDDIYIKELPVMESSDERLKRIQVKDRQQAAFEQFIQRQQNIKPFIAPAPQKGGPQHPQTKPEIAERTNVVLSPKHILYDAEHNNEGVDYQVIIQYEPFLGRITVRLKTIKTGSKSAKLSLNDIDFLNLIDATHDVSLHDLNLSKDVVVSMLKKLELVPSRTLPDTMHLKLRKRPDHAKILFQTAKDTKSLEHAREVSITPIIMEPSLLLPEKSVDHTKSNTYKKPATRSSIVETKWTRHIPENVSDENVSRLVQEYEAPVLATIDARFRAPPSPKPRTAPTEATPSRKLENRELDTKRTQDTKYSARSSLVPKVKKHMSTLAPKVSEIATESSESQVNSDENHRRLRASLEIAARKSSYPPKDGEVSSSPIEPSVGERLSATEVNTVESAIKKLKAFVHSGAAIHLYHQDVHREEVLKLYSPHSKSISLSRHCILLTFLDFIREVSVPLIPHPFHYSLDMDNVDSALFHHLWLAVEGELSVWASGRLRDIQHDIRKLVLDDVALVVAIVEKKAPLDDAEIDIIAQFESKMNVVCHMAQWFRPTQLRTSIYEGVFPMLSKRESTEPLKLSYVMTKEKPFLLPFIKNQSNLEPEFKDMLEVLYLLLFSYFNSFRAGGKKLRHFSSLVNTQHERVQVVLQAIEERQNKLLEVQLAFSDIASENILLQVHQLMKSIPRAKALTKERTCKLPLFLSNLATVLTGTYSLYQTRLLPAVVSHSNVQATRTLRFLMELVKSHVHDPIPGYNLLGNDIDEVLAHVLELEKVNLDRIKEKAEAITLSGELSAIAQVKSQSMALHKSLCWKARWDSETTISPREVCRYFFKDVAESICEFVVLLPFHQVKEPHESIDVPELHSWSLEHQVDIVARAWSMLLHLEKRPDEARFAFGINIRHINILSTDMMISSRMLSFVLTLPQVKHISVGFAASDSNIRVTFGFFEKINSVSSETSSRMHEPEVNALNTMLTHLASEHGERLSLFLLHNGLHFIMENLIDQRLLAWSRIDFGSSAFNHLLENKCIARYSNELMMNALTQIFNVIGENSSLLSYDLIKLLLDNVKVANNASCSCDSGSSITSILFIGKSIMDLLQFLLKNAIYPLSLGVKTQAPTEFSSSVPSSRLVSLNKNQKSFLSCKGLALLHQMISSPSFSVNEILTEDTPTYLLCHNMILGLLITHDMCHRSKSLVVHCEHWMYHFVPDVKNGMLEFYAPIVIDELSRFLLGIAEFTPFGVDILCDCSCAQSINWNSESFISLLHLYIEMLETKAGSRWAQEKNMAVILSLLNILGSPYIKLLNEPLSVQTMVLGAVHTQGRKIKAPGDVVRFFEFIPPELLRLLRDNLASGFEVDVIQLIGKLLNFGIERNVHLKAVEVYATILVDISMMIVDAGEPCVIDIVPPLWSTNEPFEATLKSSRISKLISNEHFKNFDDSAGTSTLLMTFFSFLEPCVDKVINVLHYPVLVSLCALLYDKPIAHVCLKYNIMSKLLNLHESFTTLHISTIQQYCIWATCLICAQTIWDSSLCVHLSDHIVKRILQHSYSSLGMINRSRSSRLEVYVQRMNKTGNSNLIDHLSERAPNALKDKNSHPGFKKVLLTLRAHLKSQLEIKASSDITDAFQESRKKSRYEDYLVEWVETLESITNERDDLTSTLYFVLIDVISCMTSSLKKIKGAEEIKVICRSILGYFIAEELTPPEYFVAAYCFALRNIIFAVYQDSNSNDLWERQTLQAFMKKLYGFIQQKKSSSSTISVGQEFSLELLWSMLLISKGKEAQFLQDESYDIYASSIAPSVKLHEEIKSRVLDRAKLKMFLDFAASHDIVVSEYTCALLSTFILNGEVASLFFSDFGFSRALMLLQQNRSKVSRNPLKSRKIQFAGTRTSDQKGLVCSDQEIYGSDIMYDRQYILNRDVRAYVQLVRFVSNCIKIVARSVDISNEYITASEKVTKETFVALIHSSHDPPVLEQALRGLRYLIVLSAAPSFEAYFNPTDFEQLFQLCFELPTSSSVQAMALKCSRLLLTKYTTNIPLCRMMFEGRHKIIPLIEQANFKLKFQAAHLMLTLSLIYINPTQLSMIADSFNTNEAKGILSGVLHEFNEWLHDEHRRTLGQVFMDVLIRLIIQLDLLSFLNDVDVVDAICNMIQASFSSSKASLMGQTDMSNRTKPLRPMLCTSLAKVVCKGGNAKWFLNTRRLDIIVSVLSQDTTLTELLDLACILITLCNEEPAISLYLGTFASRGIKFICQVLGSFYELQMVDSVEKKSSGQVDEDTSSEISIGSKVEHDINFAFDVDVLKKYRTVKARFLLKVFFQKSEELKISRHIHKVYKYYLRILRKIFEAHSNSRETFGCECRFNDGCAMCSASDLLRKANGGEILRWLLLSKRIPPTDGKKYNTVPEREANCILFNALPIIRSASFNHLFRKEFMGATQTKAIAEQGVAMLQMLRDICGDINNLYISRNKGSILDAVVTIGQLCAEEGAREYFGLHFDVPSRIFSLINYRHQANIPLLHRSCLLILCRLATCHSVVTSATFKDTIRLTCALLTETTVATDTICFSNILVFCRNVLAFGTQDFSLIHEFVTDSVLQSIGKMLRGEVDKHYGNLRREMSLVAADVLCHLLFSSRSLTNAMSLDKKTTKSSKQDAESLEPDADNPIPIDQGFQAFRKVGKIWHHRLQTMQHDELSCIASIDDMLAQTCVYLYGLNDQTALFFEILDMLTQSNESSSFLSSTCENFDTVNTELEMNNVVLPDFGFEKLTPADLRNFSHSKTSELVPGSPFSWIVLRKLLKEGTQQINVPESRVRHLVKLLTVCGSKNFKSMTKSSYAWLVSLENEFIYFLHDLVQCQKCLQEIPQVFELASTVALRYFHAACTSEKDLDHFSCRLKGFILLHGFCNTRASMKSLIDDVLLGPHGDAETQDQEKKTSTEETLHQLPAVRELLCGIQIGRKAVIWRRHIQEQLQQGMTYYIHDVSHCKILPYSLGVFRALVEYDIRFLRSFLYLDGVDILLDIMDVELDNDNSASIPMRLEVLLATLSLLKMIIYLDYDLVPAFIAKPRIFERLFVLASHTKTRVKEAAMSILSIITKDRQICNAVFAMYSTHDIPLFRQIDEKVTELRLKQLKRVFGAAVVKNEHGYYFVDTKVTIDISKFNILSSIRYFQPLKTASLVKLAQVLEPFTVQDQKSFMIRTDGHAMNLPLWLVENWAPGDLLTATISSSDKRARLLDCVTRTSRKLALNNNYIDKGFHILREDYTSSIGQHEQDVISRFVHRMLDCNLCPQSGRFRFIQQIYRNLTEDEARLKRSVRRHSSTQSNLFFPCHNSLHDLYGYLRKSILFKCLGVEQVGAICRHIPLAQTFSELHLKDLVIVSQGFITISMKPSLFCIQGLKEKTWRKTFRKGDIVWCPSWICNDNRISNYDPILYEVVSSSALVYVWTRALHEQTFAFEVIDRISQDITSLLDEMESEHFHRTLEHYIAKSSQEELLLRDLQVHSLVVLSNISLNPDMLSVLVSDNKLINAIASIAFSNMEDNITCSAIQVLRDFCHDEVTAVSLAQMQLDIFSQKNLLDGILGTIDIWKRSSDMTNQILQLLRQIYCLAPKYVERIPESWSKHHFSYFHECFSSLDTGLHEQLINLFHDLVQIHPILLTHFTTERFHLLFARLLSVCHHAALGCVLRLTLAFCKDEVTKRLIWTYPPFHDNLKSVLVRIALELENLRDTYLMTSYFDFLNMVLYSSLGHDIDQVYRNFLGTETSLIRTLTNYLIYENGFKYQADIRMTRFHLECLWRLCLKNANNVQHANLQSLAPSIQEIILSMLKEGISNPDIQLSLILCLKSFCCDLASTKTLAAIGTIDVLFVFIKGNDISRPDQCAVVSSALQAVSAIVHRFLGACNHVNEQHINLCTQIYSRSGDQRPILRDILKLYRRVCIDIRLRQLTWMSCQKLKSCLPWKAWFELLNECEKRTASRQDNLHLEIHKHLLDLIAELCQDKDIANSLCSNTPEKELRHLFWQACTHWNQSVIYQVLRVLVSVAECTIHGNDSNSTMAHLFGGNLDYLCLCNALSEKECAPLVIRFIWLWERSNGGPANIKHFSHRRKLFSVHSADILCSQKASAMERWIYMGYLHYFLCSMGSSDSNRAHYVGVKIMVKYICRALPHFNRQVISSSFDLSSYSRFSCSTWSGTRQRFLSYQNLQLMELMAMILSIDEFKKLKTEKTFQQLLDFCIDLSVQVIEVPDLMSTYVQNKSVIFVSLQVLGHGGPFAPKCESVQLFKNLSSLMKSLNGDFIAPVLDCMRKLLANNKTLTLWLAKNSPSILDILVEILNEHGVSKFEEYGADVINTLITYSYGFCFRAIFVRVPYICILRGMDEEHFSSHAWVDVLNNLALMCGSERVFSHVDDNLFNTFCCHLLQVSTKKLVLSNCHFDKWISLFGNLADIPCFQEQMVINWTHLGYRFVSMLITTILASSESRTYVISTLVTFQKVVAVACPSLIQLILSMTAELKMASDIIGDSSANIQVRTDCVDIIESLSKSASMRLEDKTVLWELSKFCIKSEEKFQKPYPGLLKVLTFMLKTTVKQLDHGLSCTEPFRNIWENIIHLACDDQYYESLHCPSGVIFLKELTSSLTYLRSNHQCATLFLSTSLQKLLEHAKSIITIDFEPSVWFITPYQSFNGELYSTKFRRLWYQRIACLETQYDWTKRCKNTSFNKKALLEGSSKESKFLFMDNLAKEFGCTEASISDDAMRRFPPQPRQRLVNLYFTVIECVEIFQQYFEPVRTVVFDLEWRSNLEWSLCHFLCLFLNSDSVTEAFFEKNMISMHSVFINLVNDFHAIFISNEQILQHLIILSGSKDYPRLRKLATFFLWKLLNRSKSATETEGFLLKYFAPNRCSIFLDLSDNILHGNQGGFLDVQFYTEWQDLILSTSGLLSELSSDLTIACWLASNGYISMLLSTLHVYQSNLLTSINIAFLTLVERVANSGQHNLHAENPGLILYCLNCAGSNICNNLRGLGIYVTYVLCSNVSGMIELQQILFKKPNKELEGNISVAILSSRQNISSRAHLDSLTEGLKCPEYRAQRGAMYLVCELCANPQHAMALRANLESSTALVTLVTGVLSSTLGTEGRNCVEIRGNINHIDSEAQYRMQSGLYAITCLQRLNIMSDVLTDDICGNKIITELFASLGWTNLNVSLGVSGLLCDIFRHATSSLPKADGKFGKEVKEAVERPRRNPLYRMQLFQHKDNSGLPSFFILLTRWVEWFSKERCRSHVVILSRVLEVLKISLTLFFKTIFYPQNTCSRKYHCLLLENVVDISFRSKDIADEEEWPVILLEALGVIYEMCNHIDYPCHPFEDPSLVMDLLNCIETSTGRHLEVASQVLEVITKHQPVKECIYSNDLISFVAMIEQPDYLPILESLLQSIKHLVVKTSPPSQPNYAEKLAATLFRHKSPRTEECEDSTAFRRINVDIRAKVLPGHSVVLNPVYNLSISLSESKELKRQVVLLSSTLHGQEIWYVSTNVSELSLSITNDDNQEICKRFTHQCGLRMQSKREGNDSDHDIEVLVTDDYQTDFHNLTGPLGEVLKLCYRKNLVSTMSIVSEVICEMCKHESIFCDSSFNIWFFVAFLCCKGCSIRSFGYDMQYFRAIASCAASQPTQIVRFLSHVMFLLQLLELYGFSSSALQPNETTGKHNNRCMRCNDTFIFFVAVANIVANYGSVTLVEKVFRTFLLEHSGVIMFLCGQHGSYENVCSGYFYIQRHFIKCLPSHAVILSHHCFIERNLKHIMECRHATDESVEQAVRLATYLVSNPESCHRFVSNNGLFFIGRAGQILYSNMAQGCRKPHVTVLRQLIVCAAFLYEHMLKSTHVSQQVESHFFPLNLTSDIMPFLEILLWPLMPIDGTFVWKDSTLLASKLLKEVFESRPARLLLEKHLVRIAFRLTESRTKIIQSAIEACLKCTEWDLVHSADVVHRIYFAAIRRGIKLGMLPGECTDLVPKNATLDNQEGHIQRRTTFDSIKDMVSIKVENTKTTDEALNPYREQLLYCLSFTEQHRDGRLRNILLKNRKKGIGETLSAVNNSARVLVLIHRILQMLFESYVGVVSTKKIDFCDKKVAKILTFCKQLETIGAHVVSALNQMDVSYFGLILAQFHDIRIPYSEEQNPLECRHIMRDNTKKLLFILRRIMDKKKLKPLMDERSFFEAEEILDSFRLEFAVDMRRRLGASCFANASVADLMCEAAEVGGLNAFSTFLSSCKYLFKRSMLNDDNTYSKLEDFMAGSTTSTVQVSTKKSVEPSIAPSSVSLLSRMASCCGYYHQANRRNVQEKEASANTSTSLSGQHRRRKNTEIVRARVSERSMTSAFPLASVLYCPIHEHVSNIRVIWVLLREYGLIYASQSSAFHVTLKPNFVEDFCIGISSEKQDIIIDHLLKNESCSNDWHMERQLNQSDIQVVAMNLEACMSRHDIDAKLYHVRLLTQTTNMWQFLVSPVYRTRLLHVQYILSCLRHDESLQSAQRVFQASQDVHVWNSKELAHEHLGKSHLVDKRTCSNESSQNFKRKMYLAWSWMQNSNNAGSDKNTDELHTLSLATIYDEYVLPVCDRQLYDPLSEQMAWEHFIESINHNQFPSWVFRIDDPGTSTALRAITKVYRSILRAIISIAFWRLEEFSLDTQDLLNRRSWPEGKVIHSNLTKRTHLDTDIIESIIIYKHFNKAVGELFRVWMLESGSLGLSMWQHPGFFIFGCTLPAIVLFAYLPSLKAHSKYDTEQVDYHMKWFLGVYFCVLFSLVMWSIVLLVKKTENLVFQERQEVRFFPIKRHYSNYLAIYTLFSDLVQHNSIPFSDRVKWTAGYKLPSLIHYFGGLGITSFDFIDMGSVNLAYVKCAFAGGILLTFLIILKCANKFHKTHSTLNSRLTKDLPPLVSGLLFVGIVNSFSSLLFCCTCDQFSDNPTALQACLKQRNGSKEPFLYSYPDLDLTCWSHDHMPMAYIGIMGLTFIVPIGILGAGMSQVLFPLEFLDIKFSPIIGLTSQLVKTISAISALFFTFRTAYMVAIGFATNLFLFCLTLIVNKTSSIWYIGIIKSAIYILSAWTSLCAFVNIFSGAPTSTPIYYLNLGWFVIMSVVCAWLALGLRFRTRRDDRARKERLRDYQLLNNTSESTHPTETEEEMLKQALKLLQTGRLEDVAPRGFMEAAKLRADELLFQSLTSQTNDFIRLSTQSIENPTCSEIMFMRRAKRLSRRATLFGETGQMGVSQGNRSSSNQKAA